MSDTLPKIHCLHSMKVEVTAGRTYAWCACGLSKKQPLCDGSHANTAFKPIVYKAESDRVVGFCGCKHTQKAPLCDGSHRNLNA